MSLTPSPQMNSEQSSKSTPQHCVEESLRKDQMTKPAVGAASVYSHESLHLLCHCWDCLPRCSQNWLLHGYHPVLLFTDSQCPAMGQHIRPLKCLW